MMMCQIDARHPVHRCTACGSEAVAFADPLSPETSSLRCRACGAPAGRMADLEVRETKGPASPAAPTHPKADNRG
jgi:DNA-directed RNA polymerase subunit RPC12/RpoP